MLSFSRSCTLLKFSTIEQSLIIQPFSGNSRASLFCRTLPKIISKRQEGWTFLRGYSPVREVNEQDSQIRETRKSRFPRLRILVIESVLLRWEGYKSTAVGGKRLCNCKPPTKLSHLLYPDRVNNMTPSDRRAGPQR